jgi:hypothetical protein
MTNSQLPIDAVPASYHYRSPSEVSGSTRIPVNPFGFIVHIATAVL